MNLRTVANWFEYAVAAVTAVVIALLFTNSPTPAPPAPAAAVEASGGIDGGALYQQRCAGCHGGDGSGGIGPRLAGGRVIDKYPQPEDQAAVVSGGRGGMPSFAARLTPDEIAAVVDYTRTVLAGVTP